MTMQAEGDEMPGPMPNPNRRRRNAPTIPTTSLPAGGRPGPAPDLPEWVELAAAGRAWWEWAWSTPQAAAWSDGDVAFVARRAMLEDDIAVLGRLESLDAFDVLEGKSGAEVKRLLGALAGAASGRVSVHNAAVQMDDRLGLTPKSMAALRWEIVDSTPEGKAPAAKNELDERRKRREAAAG